MEGKGLQTGKEVKAFFYPEKENVGIVFARVDLPGKPMVRLREAFDLATDRRSAVGLGGASVETVEHLLAALWGAEIDNVRVELDSSELPALDGSASNFLEAVKDNTKEQPAPKEFIGIKEPIWAEEGNSFLGIFPSENFKISYFLEYPVPSIGKQFFSSAVDPRTFREEIAPARTFCMKQEAEMLLKQGYGKGASLKNTLVMDETGPVDNELRFPDEPVRHKVLDLIGDLYLLGRPLKARIVAIRSGHKLNLALVKKLKGSV